VIDGIGVELHPDDITVETLQKLKVAGVSRISVGVQSFDAGVLQKLGRNPLDVRRLFSTLQEVPFDTVAMDFIFAIEGQTFASVKSDIDTAFANGANHIALYPFIDFAFAKHGVRKMSKSAMKKLLYDIADYCESQGYLRDSIWTFGKPGVDKYSSMTRDNYLGFGCSAATLLSDQFKVNTFSPDAYAERINAGKLPTALTIRFTRRQRMIYWFFWRLYTMRLTVIDFECAFGFPK
jgi:oxygen-independent coproporphyrinogen-3 oxidase